MPYYNKTKIYEQALLIIEEEKLVFSHEVITILPISHDTFYRWWPVGSDKYEQLKEALEANRVSIKNKVRRKWEDSDNATAQIALYKLLGTPEERAVLSGQVVDITSKGQQIQPASGLTLEQAAELLKRLNDEI